MSVDKLPISNACIDYQKEFEKLKILVNALRSKYDNMRLTETDMQEYMKLLGSLETCELMLSFLNEVNNVLVNES